MMKVVTFGEVMLRLKSPGHERLMQCLAEPPLSSGPTWPYPGQLRHAAGFVSVLPNNDLASLPAPAARLYVDAPHRPRRRAHEYFLETGSNQRASKVIYDRAHAPSPRPNRAISTGTTPRTRLFHITGITPPSAKARPTCRWRRYRPPSAGADSELRLNYRKNWKYGKTAAEVMGWCAIRHGHRQRGFQMSRVNRRRHDVERGEIGRTLPRHRGGHGAPNLKGGHHPAASQSADRNLRRPVRTGWSSCSAAGMKSPTLWTAWAGATAFAAGSSLA